MQVEVLDLLLQLRRVGAVVVDDDVGCCQTLAAGGLMGHDLTNHVFTQVAALHDPLNLGLLFAIHHQNPIDATTPMG